MLQPGQVVVMDNATFHKGGRTLATDSASWLSVAVHEQLIHRTSTRLSNAGLGSKVEFALQLDQFDCLRDAIEYVLHLAS
jgi:hypothetical protein